MAKKVEVDDEKREGETASSHFFPFLLREAKLSRSLLSPPPQLSSHGPPLRLPHDHLQPRGQALPSRVRDGGHQQRRRGARRARERRRRARRGEADHVQGD